MLGWEGTHGGFGGLSWLCATKLRVGDAKQLRPSIRCFGIDFGRAQMGLAISVVDSWIRNTAWRISLFPGSTEYPLKRTPTFSQPAMLSASGFPVPFSMRDKVDAETLV